MSITLGIERDIAELRDDDRSVTVVRASTMTHIAWVPEEWLPAALETLSGLSERHPSRTILLVPQPDAEDGVETEVWLERFRLGGIEREVCTEVITLRLGGARVQAAASLVLALVRPDLPVFLRCRGQPAFGAPALESLLGVVDRFIVDSSEWPDLPEAYRELVACFDRVAVSDIAWARTERWRVALARRWPEIAAVGELCVVGPRADALLLAGWLESRLEHRVQLVHDQAPAIESVAADGEGIAAEAADADTPSELLSRELDRLGREPVYEQAVRAQVGAGRGLEHP
jgi:glucose-6-phosphate dehydrogenase assembly protein OpcA